MPLFGKKKNSSGAKSGGGYPTQPAYPTQKLAYPTQQPGYPTQPPAYHQKAPPQYGAPPPPYYQPQPQATQQISTLNVSVGVAAPVPSVYQPPAVPGEQVIGVFEQGARFDHNKPVNIPPPPPGVAPTAAQMAAAQGQTVQMTQQKRDVWGFGSDGGATFF